VDRAKIVADLKRESPPETKKSCQQQQQQLYLTPGSLFTFPSALSFLKTIDLVDQQRFFLFFFNICFLSRSNLSVVGQKLVSATHVYAHKQPQKQQTHRHLWVGAGIHTLSSSSFLFFPDSSLPIPTFNNNPRRTS
jgi:hypothetical protein